MGQHASRPSAPVAQEAQEPSLYERLGGIFAIANVIDFFSDRVLEDAMVGVDSENEFLREWSTQCVDRLPGLKWMRTLWLADISGGPYTFVPTRPGATHLGLENGHCNLRISPAEFDRVAQILQRTLDHFAVPERESHEVLSAFAAHKDEVTAGYYQPDACTAARHCPFTRASQ